MFTQYISFFEPIFKHKYEKDNLWLWGSYVGFILLSQKM